MTGILIRRLWGRIRDNDWEAGSIHKPRMARSQERLEEPRKDSSREVLEGQWLC